MTLPQPTILSHEVYPKVDKLDVGFLAGITGEEMNSNFNALRRQFRQEAIENEHVLDKAKMRADTVMQMLLGPTVKSMGRSFAWKSAIKTVKGSPQQKMICAAKVEQQALCRLKLTSLCRQMRRVHHVIRKKCWLISLYST